MMALKSLWGGSLGGHLHKCLWQRRGKSPGNHEWQNKVSWSSDLGMRLSSFKLWLNHVNSNFIMWQILHSSFFELQIAQSLLSSSTELLPVSQQFTKGILTSPQHCTCSLFLYLISMVYQRDIYPLNISGHCHSSCCSLTTQLPGRRFMLSSPISTSSAPWWFTKVILCLSQSNSIALPM